MTPKIYCAIDTPDIDKAKSLIRAMPHEHIGVKLGLEFFNTFGPGGIEEVLDGANAPLFLDLKFHDIPNTVAGAVRTVSHRLKPAYLNLHASGGPEMMRAAKDACYEGTKLLAVTVLTSLDDTNLEQVGQSVPARDQVVRLAKLTQDSGLGGVVCSSHEIEAIRAECGPDFTLMVPGIRPAGSAVLDQKRVMTPKEALDKGATHLVIGRPITGADDPGAAARRILEEIE